MRPIDQELQRAQEALDQADASLRTQAQSYVRLRQQVLPMATPEPPELTLFDELTPWDTDNERQDACGPGKSGDDHFPR